MVKVLQFSPPQLTWKGTPPKDENNYEKNCYATSSSEEWGLTPRKIREFECDTHSCGCQLYISIPAGAMRQSELPRGGSTSSWFPAVGRCSGVTALPSIVRQRHCWCRWDTVPPASFRWLRKAEAQWSRVRQESNIYMLTIHKVYFTTPQNLNTRLIFPPNMQEESSFAGWLDHLECNMWAVFKRSCSSEGAKGMLMPAAYAAAYAPAVLAYVQEELIRWCLRGLTHTRVLLTRGPSCHPLTKNE